jgi:exonuclease SbcC
MRIQEIHMNGIKDQNAVQILTGKDIICGLNGSGKTSRIQSLGISLLGYCPGKGKTPAETFKLATEEDMSVGLKMDDFQFSREFKRKERNKRDGSREITISQDISLSPSRGEKSLAQKEARIMAECGNFPAMLDFQQFLDLSDAKRRDFIYGLSPITTEDWDRNRVYEYLVEHLLTDELGINDQDKYNIMNQLIAGAMEQYSASYDVQAGILAMLEWSKAKQTHWNEEKKNAQGAVKKLSDLKNELQQTDRNIEDNKKELEDLREQLSDIKAQIARDTEKAKVIEKRLARLEELRISIAQLKDSLAKPLDLSAIEQHIAAEEARVKEVDITRQLAELQEQIKANGQESLSKQQERQEKYDRLSECRANIKILSTQIQHISQQKGICVISPLIGCNKDFAPFLEWANKEIERLQQEESQLNEDHTGLLNALVGLGDKRRELDAAIQGLNTQAAQQQKENDYARKAIAEFERQKVDAENARGKIAERAKTLQEEYDKLQSEPIEPIAPIDILEKRRGGLQGQIDAFKSKLEEQQKAKTTLSNMRSSMIDSKEATHYADNCKYLVEALGPKGLQGELVKGILEPIRSAIQENLLLMNIHNEFYFQTESDTGKEVFQFGWINEKGNQVNFDGLSTGEKILLLAAMMVTLLERSNPPLKVLAIDNIENLDKNNFSYAIAGLDKISPKLGNIILAGVIDTQEIDGGWKVWDLSKPLEAEGVAQIA